MTYRALAPLLVCTLAACSPNVEQGFADCSDGKCDQAVSRVHAPALLINDVELLGALEEHGHALGSALGDGTSEVAKDLAQNSLRYQQLVRTIQSDLDEITDADPKAGVGFDFEHRLFDIRWLESSAVRFRLIAVTNRMDLAVSKPGTCGEVRFVYRLEYRADYGVSRLPMTLMLVRDQPQIAGSCFAVATSWEDHGGNLDTLLSMFSNLHQPSSMELNLQAVRWPSSARKNMGGHAEYLLRVFEFGFAGLAPSKLPNTIALDLDSSEKDQLAEWITENVASIDEGTAQVPEQFLATKAISVSPRGLSRMANRPFLQAFPRPEETFDDVDLQGLRLVKSPAGLLRRLDTMSCQGCHQSRGQAGFHILGEEDRDAPRSNAMEVGSSPHLNDELAWRHEQLIDMKNFVATPQPRPFAERDDTVPGIYGAHCGLGDPSFASWTCAEGFVCADINGEEVGMCVSETLGAGDACHLASVSLEADPHLDTISNVDVQSCTSPSGAAGRCTNFVGGFPNGHCSGECEGREKGEIVPGVGDAICGELASPGFNQCLFDGNDFTECIANNGKTLRRRCDAVTPCGDDYVCAGVPGAPAGVGSCQPPYFVFQGRVDGHNVPE